jgi:hypothetical protein
MRCDVDDRFEQPANVAKNVAWDSHRSCRHAASIKARQEISDYVRSQCRDASCRGECSLTSKMVDRNTTIIASPSTTGKHWSFRVKSPNEASQLPYDGVMLARLSQR